MKYICATCTKEAEQYVIHDTENDPHMGPPEIYLPLDDVGREVEKLEALLLKKFDILSQDYYHVYAKVEDAKELLRIARRLLMEALAYKEDEL